MSRSFKKSPCWAWTCYHSNKKDKRNANRKLRHKNKQIVRDRGKGKVISQDVLNWEWCDYLPINEKMKFTDPYCWEFNASELCNADFKTMREVSDVWTFSSDGLAYYHGEPDWRDDNDFQDDTKEEFMSRVRDRHTKKYYDYGGNIRNGMFVEYMAKWYYYRWKMK